MIFKDIKTSELMQCINLVTQLGLTMVASIMVAGFIGYMVDKLFGIGHCFIIILGIVGIGGGFVSSYKVIIKSMDRYDRKNGS